MKLSKHYFTLYSTIGPTDAQVFISQIADLLSCSERHAKSVIKQLQVQEWICWKPSSGRGNASTLTFLLKPQEVEQQRVQTWIEDGDIKRALRWMEQQPELEPSFVKLVEDQFQWVRDDGLDILRYPLYRQIHTLLPFNMTTKHEWHLANHIFNRLIRYNYEKHEFVPELAHHWEQLDNGRTWRVYIRKGILFHDGSPLTSQTVKDNVKLWKEMKINRWRTKMIEDITHIEENSSTVITFHLLQPNKLFMHLFTDYQSMIIPIHLYKKDPETFKMRPIGSGPYQITDYIKGYLVLEAFSNYFGYRPLLDKVELFDIPNSPYSIPRQVHYKLLNQETKSMKKYDSVFPELGGIYLVVNHKKAGIHRHTNFRRMLSYAIDRAKRFSNHPKHEVRFPDSLFDEHAGILRQKSNFDEAKKWFLEQGLTGQTLKLTATNYEQNPYFSFELEQLTEVFSELGIKLQSEIIDIHQLAESDQLHKTDLIVTEISLSEDRLFFMLNALTDNTSFILNTLPPEAKGYLLSMLDVVSQSPDTQAAYKSLRNIESFLLDNHYLIFLYQRQTHALIEADEKLQGIEFNSFNLLNYDKLWYKP
ncbi:ABC transporter substrate-binding protein [Halalkalibacter alkaliphilus]|uniref:ABC transporter substrate-binding protein n=1 Tax=Halalkalibacter alkaliphilus TaxID=2917993 RepID=A0A9X2CUF3_9BACI|nr:ABC transporter substrate-binding protein [Halalkalibacter alkaliphilus]MCL7748443.1 ABC transporter substrate-binding protein [Halalkalibacter alkaliphilus]